VTVHAEALAALGTVFTFEGRLEEAAPLFEEALMTLEREQAWPALTQSLIGYGIYMITSHRHRSAHALYREALVLAEEHDLPSAALRARYNLAGLALDQHRFADCLAEVDEALAVARERGDRTWEHMLHTQSIGALVILGRWDEAIDTGENFLSHSDQNGVVTATFLASVAAARSSEDLLRRCRDAAEPWVEGANLDLRCSAITTLARVALHDDDPRRALEMAQAVVEEKYGTSAETLAEAYGIAVEAAGELADETAMSTLAAWVDDLPPARAGSLLRAGRARLLAELAVRQGDAVAATRHEGQAIDILRGVGARPLLARALLDRARHHGDPDAQAETRAIATDLEATAWLERMDRRDQPATASTSTRG
jgi:tetratricopeptide (TPR) repeat protein